METDYLIVGAGAMGMAFADVIFSECPEARLVLVDRRAKAGGHWNDAYPFVALHQPAAAYGVNSARLGQGGTDLSSRAEIVFYYERVMKKLLASGRAHFLSMSEYQSDGRVASIWDRDHVVEIDARRKIVDATYMNVEVPATHPPRYEIDEDVVVAPPNALSRIEAARQNYVVIGAGKTAIDAILFLLSEGLEAERITWIMPNDMWLWNRGMIQPPIVGMEFVRHLRAIIAAETIDDIFLQLEKAGSLFRLDKGMMPSKWRCATVDQAELRDLRKVKRIIRMGRVKRLTKNEAHLDGGSLSIGSDTLYVDCASNGLARREAKPIFSADRIVLQSVMICQQVFSAAVIAHLEAMRLSDAERNAMWSVIPHPEQKRHLPSCMVSSLENLLRANRYMPFWLWRSRLNIPGHAPLYRYAKTAWRILRLLPDARMSANRLAAK